MMKKATCLLALMLFPVVSSCSDSKDNEFPAPPSEQDGGTKDEDTSGEYPENTSRLWKEFVKDTEENRPSVLLDFSYAGYRHGEQAIPEVNCPVYNVCDYGAVPNDGQSDREAVEKAIQIACSKGRGIIYFPSGRYHLRPLDAPNHPILIDSDNIVLRGAGAGEGGTELFMEYPNKVLDTSLWNTPELISFRYVKSTDKRLAAITSDAPKGSFSIEVSSTSGLYIGKWVSIRLKNNDTRLIEQELKPNSVKAEWRELLDQGIQVTEYHEIQNIIGNKVVFKEPILHAVEAKWGWTVHDFSHHVGVGVEDIAFVGNFKERFEHHKNALHDSGFRMLGLMRQVNAWVRRCRFTNVSEALSVMLCSNVTVHSCDITGNPGHSAIRSQASTRVFIGKVHDEAGQFHSTGVSKTSIGTVLWRNETASHSCFESHSSQPRATLLDACRGGLMPNHAGGDAGAAPNHLSDLVLWNYYKTDSFNGDFNLWTRNNYFQQPIFVGLQGTPITFSSAQVKVNEMQGSEAYPYSLYEAQLKKRMGSLPEWLMKLR